MVQTIFERYENKYLISQDQFKALMPVLRDRMTPDRYASYSVSSIYYDTADYRIIRRTLEKPVYREKLRLRGYGRIDADTRVFLELKKKYEKRVYKRRICLPCARARDFPEGGWDSLGGEGEFNDAQVKGEIRQFLRIYQIRPRVLIRCDRIALNEEAGLRVTFDTDLRFRRDRLTLEGDPGGVSLLAPEKVLMEIKTPGAIPLWLCRLLSGQGIFPVSFSKYGTCYTNFITKPRPGSAAVA